MWMGPRGFFFGICMYKAHLGEIFHPIYNDCRGPSCEFVRFGKILVVLEFCLRRVMCLSTIPNCHFLM